MKTIAYDKDARDVVWAHVEDREALRQRAHARLRMRLGEWFLDTRVGFLHPDIMEKGITMETIEQAVRKQLLEDEEITAVTAVNATKDNSTRVVRISWNALSVYGEIGESL